MKMEPSNLANVCGRADSYRLDIEHVIKALRRRSERCREEQKTPSMTTVLSLYEEDLEEETAYCDDDENL